MVADTLFPRQRGIFPKNMPLSIFVKIVQFIATVSRLLSVLSLLSLMEHRINYLSMFSICSGDTPCPVLSSLFLLACSVTSVPSLSLCVILFHRHFHFVSLASTAALLYVHVLCQFPLSHFCSHGLSMPPLASRCLSLQHCRCHHIGHVIVCLTLLRLFPLVQCNFSLTIPLLCMCIQ